MWPKEGINVCYSQTVINKSLQWGLLLFFLLFFLVNEVFFPYILKFSFTRTIGVWVPCQTTVSQVSRHISEAV